MTNKDLCIAHCVVESGAACPLFVRPTKHISRLKAIATLIAGCLGPTQTSQALGIGGVIVCVYLTDPRFQPARGK